MINTLALTDVLAKLDVFKGKEATLEAIVTELKSELIYRLLAFTKEYTVTVEDVIAVLEEGKWMLSEVELVYDVVKLKEYKPFTTTFTTSGKILIENDLRRYFKGGGSFDINYTKGIIECSEFYAKQGLLHGFVGNSCPRLYYSKEEETILIGVDYDEDDEPILPNESYKRLASVVTDLWWYSICDAERINAKNCKVHEITAGTWELTHYYGISSSKYPYAKLKLIK